MVPKDAPYIPSLVSIYSICSRSNSRFQQTLLESFGSVFGPRYPYTKEYIAEQHEASKEVRQF